MIIREYKSEDIENIAELFYHTVHSVNAKDYNKEQLNVWAKKDMNLDIWNKSFLEHNTIVAVENQKIVGFGDITKEGYLDRLYVHKDYQKRKIATKICDALEQSITVSKITTHASITAKPFFQKRGYQTIREQEVERKGILLKNYIMEKRTDNLTVF